MNTFYKFGFSLYLTLSFGAMLLFVPMSALPQLQACPTTGNYVLEVVPLSVCNNPDVYFCNCNSHAGGTIFSGQSSKLQARAPKAYETGEPADPNGGTVPCNKAVTCDWERDFPFTCQNGVCAPPVSILFCDIYVTNIPNAWQTVTQASTCD